MAGKKQFRMASFACDEPSPVATIESILTLFLHRFSSVRFLGDLEQ